MEIIVAYDANSWPSNMDPSSRETHHFLIQDLKARFRDCPYIHLHFVELFQVLPKVQEFASLRSHIMVDEFCLHHERLRERFRSYVGNFSIPQVTRKRLKLKNCGLLDCLKMSGFDVFLHVRAFKAGCGSLERTLISCPILSVPRGLWISS